MNIELFISNLFNEQHKEWITLSLSHLKKQAKFNKNKFEEHQKYERTRSDLPSCTLKTAAITKRKLEHLIMESMEDMHAEPTKTASSKKKKTQHNTKKTTQWTPCFSGMSLSNLMSIGKLPLATYLSDISHLCYAYQQEALKVIAQTNRVQGVLKIATGAGKTRLQILLANYLVANKVNGPIYIVTATQQLVDQFYLDFEETLELLGVQAHLNMLDIIKVRSGSGNVPWMNYWANDILKKQTKVVLFCQESYDKLQHKLSEVPLANYIPPAIVFLDEFHLYTATADILLGSKATIVGFSATPPKNVSPIYSFSRLDSLQCGITVPMIIDKLPYQLNNTNEKRTQKIAELIKNHSHPSNGRPLKESKGVIFVSSIEEADQLATSLNQLLSKNLLFSVHSKLNNYNTLIATFQKKELDSPGILIVVGMLQTGYNDKNLSWCIIARNKNENSTMVQQIIGRVLRKNPAHPNKIAYIIADTHLNIHEFGPLRDDAALKLASNEYFKTNHQIIYLDILRAIKAGEPFKSYQLLFELNRLQRHSLKKHLELLLNTDKQDWLEGMCRWNQQLTNEEGYKQDLLFCFAHEAYGFLSDKQKTEHKELYTAKRFSVLLGTLNQFLPNKLTSWLAKTGEKSCAYYVKTMKNKYGCNEYWNVFNEYQQIANTSIYPRRLEDTRTHQPKDKDTSSTMHRLFSPKPKHEELVINTSYQYEVEDIQAILRLRLDSCHVPGLKILAAADMTGNYVGNRVVDVLQQYMTGLEGQMAKNSAVEQNIIIPIAYNAHWVGIRLQLKIGLAPQITYYNSIKGYESDTELMSQILNEVNQVFDGHAVPVMHYFAKCLEQNDGTSCGAFLIENIYSDLKQGNWRLSTANILTKAIRERHLKLLHDYDPNFYNGFYERQATNQPAAFDEDFIL
ncbi:DEAD/DEAH box helicase [Legionella drancourtii]|uniref:Helicase ATP-binding domain-containing protein n=1 Tax=Legionella drancourtii LLAP12 TaxID=658187 RepID=G9EIN4_9GAMM|nr:DEAD/DEAH box helicase family protein [Legionella drancourtii]EHL32802.1 hypothetical protein LDG_5040 [Legionella drancourtii LLAP12]